MARIFDLVPKILLLRKLKFFFNNRNVSSITSIILVSTEYSNYNFQLCPELHTLLFPLKSLCVVSQIILLLLMSESVLLNPRPLIVEMNRMAFGPKG